MKHPLQRRVTIKDVAAEAGMSFATAAAALRGAPHVRDEKRKRAAAAAKKLGYVPNRAAAALATHNRRIRQDATPIALLEFSPYWQSQLEARTVQARCNELGYAVRRIALEKVDDQRALGNQLYSQGVEGLLIGRVRPHSAVELDLPWEKFSIVCMNRFDRIMPFHTVRYDCVAAVRLVFEKLLAAGCRRIGLSLVIHDPAVYDDYDRIGAFLEMQRRFFEEENRIGVLRYGQATRREQFDEWFVKHRPDGVIALSGAEFYFLKDQGFQPPAGCKLAVLVRQPAKQNELPLLAGAVENRTLMTRMSVELLDQEIRHQRKGIPETPYDVVIPPVFAPGTSLGDA